MSQPSRLKPRIIRATEVTPEAMLEIQGRYATLLKDYISLAENHVELLKKHHQLWDERLKGVTVTR